MGRRLPWQHPELRVQHTIPDPPGFKDSHQTKNTPRNPPSTSRQPPSSNLVMRSSGRPSGRGRLIQEMGTPSRRRQEAPASTPSSTIHRTNGLISQGEVYCNCDPRLKAAHLTAGKDSRNPGRKFYGCIVKKCNLFIWEDQAIARSGGTLASSSSNNAPAEPPTPTPGPEKKGKKTVQIAPPTATQMPTPSTKATSSKKTRTQPIQHYFAKATKAEPQDGKSTDPSSTSEEEAQNVDVPSSSSRPSGTSSATLAASTPSLGDKRKRAGEVDEYGITSDEERDLGEAMERSTRKFQATTAAPTFDAPTPTAQRITEQSDMAAPPTARRLFTEERPQRTPAPVQPSPSNQVSATDEVMALLPNTLDASVAEAVKLALKRHDERLRGVIQGRESVRAQVKAKDDRIATLQARVTALENKTQMQRDQITTMKAGLANLYSQH
ncbi:hypothetical protein B0T11DRAFT_277966 [Plectosphaerella cucumerina]|uniref:GRF-type domain-containing protein n=1 Tax=Plectosphaerella cucumerina TaxID=40658 RepID=A0A8K0X6L0_9PEZI|nr:hypothetical protein B0T11DRAFT_277966 [Plectosphaerella cucumerina]